MNEDQTNRPEEEQPKEEQKEASELEAKQTNQSSTKEWRSPISIATGRRVILEENLCGSSEGEA